MGQQLVKTPQVCEAEVILFTSRIFISKGKNTNEICIYERHIEKDSIFGEKKQQCKTEGQNIPALKLINKPS